MVEPYEENSALYEHYFLLQKIYIYIAGNRRGAGSSQHVAGDGSGSPPPDNRLSGLRQNAAARSQADVRRGIDEAENRNRAGYIFRGNLRHILQRGAFDGHQRVQGNRLDAQLC